MNRKGKYFSAALVALLFACSPTLLLSQASLDSVAGRVTDQSQGVIPGAQVKLVEDSTGVTLTTTTNAVGAYEFVGLPLGTYTLTVTQQGFQTWTRPGITLHEGQNAMVDATLAVGSTTQTVTVTVAQTLTRVTLTKPANVKDGATLQLSAIAYDQFLNPIRTPITWSMVSGPGSVNSQGVYTAPKFGTGKAVVKASATVNGITVSSTTTLTIT